MAKDFEVLGLIKVDDQGSVTLGSFGEKLKSIIKQGGGATSVLKGIASAAAGVGIMKTVGDFFEGSAKAAMDEQQQVAILSQTMQDNVGATKDQVDATESWIESLARATGIAHDSMIPAFDVLESSTKDNAESEHLLADAADVATARHLDLQSVAVALGRAVQGNVASLSRYGIQTKDAAGKTMSYQQILASLEQTYHGAAQAASDTAAGGMAKLQESFSQLKEHIGDEILPIIGQVVNAISKLTGWFMSLPGPIQKIVIIGGGMVAMFAGLGMVLNPAITMVKTLIPLLAGTGEAAAEAAVGEEAAGTAGEAMGVGMTVALGPIGLIIAAIAALIAIVVACIHWHKQLGEAFKAAWHGMVDAARAVKTGVVDFFKDAPMWLYDAGKQLLSGLWHGIEHEATALYDGIKSIAHKVTGFFKGIFGIHSPSKVFADMGQQLMAGLGQGINVGVPAVSAQVQGINLGSPQVASGFGGPQSNSYLIQLLERAVSAVEGAEQLLYNMSKGNNNAFAMTGGSINYSLKASLAGV